MRKLWYAGAAIVGGIVLFGATPAQADLLPGTGTAETQADERLADLLGQSNGLSVSNPLRHSSLQDTAVGRNPVAQLRAGQNSPDLDPLLPGNSAHEGRPQLPLLGEATGEPRPQLPLLPGETAHDTRPQLPAADVIGGALRPADRGSPVDGLAAQELPLQQLPVRLLPLNQLFTGGLPLFGGLNPDGRTPAAAQRPTARQTEAFEGGVPLLGGLGGLLPVNRTPAGDTPDSTGLPLGGMAALPSLGRPATPEQPAPSTVPDDPRLHEEPVEDEESRREFSPAGRPIAGPDPQYN